MDEDLLRDFLKLLPSLHVDEEILKPYFVNNPPERAYNIDNTIFHEYNQKYYDAELVQFVVHKRMRDQEADLPYSTSDTNVCKESENATSNPELTKNEQSGVVINSKTYLKDHNWNTLLSLEGLFQCAVCDEIMAPDTVDDHISTVSHKINLERYRPLSEYELCIVRRIENYYHCGVCNLLLEEIYNHMKTETHKENYLNAMKQVSDIVSDSVLAINIPLNNDSDDEIIKLIHENVSILNLNKNDSIVPANNANIPSNSKPIVKYSGVVKNNKTININTPEQVTNSKVPFPNINKNTKTIENKKAPIINRNVKVPFSNFIQPAKNTKPVQNLTPININHNYDVNFPDLNRPVNKPQILATPGSNNDLENNIEKPDNDSDSFKDKTSQVNNKKVNNKLIQKKTSNKSRAVNSVNQNNFGKAHSTVLSNSQVGTNVNKPSTTSYASAAKKYFGVSPEHVSLSNGNETVKVKYDCWHMIISRRNKTFYCMACTETNISDKLIHCSSEGHLNNLKKCTIVEVHNDLFIRKVGGKFCHCSHCNYLQNPPDIANHIAKKHSQITINDPQETSEESKKSSDPIKSIVYTATGKNVSTDAHRAVHSASPDSAKSEKSDSARASDRPDSANTCDRSDSARSTDSPTTRDPASIVPNPTNVFNTEIKICPFDLELTINLFYYNVIFIQVDKLVCGLCDCSVPMDPVQHICGTRHMEILRLTLFIPKFNNNLIREIRGKLHCALCNVYATNENIFTHIMNPPHTALLSKATCPSHIGAPANMVPNVPPVGLNMNPVRNPMYGWWQTTPQFTGNRLVSMMPFRAPILYTRPVYPYLVQRGCNPIMLAPNVKNIPSTDTKTAGNDANTMKILELNEATSKTNVLANSNTNVIAQEIKFLVREVEKNESNSRNKGEETESTNDIPQEIKSLVPTVGTTNIKSPEIVEDVPREVENLESNSRNKGQETESINDIPQEIKSLVPIVATTNIKSREIVEEVPREVDKIESNSRNEDVQPDSTNFLTCEIKPLIRTVFDKDTKNSEKVVKNDTQANKNDVANANVASKDIRRISQKNLDNKLIKKAKKEKSKRTDTGIAKESRNGKKESAAKKSLILNEIKQNVNELISKEINTPSINYSDSRNKEYTPDTTNVLNNNLTTESTNATIKLNILPILNIDKTIPPTDITSQLTPDTTGTGSKLPLDENNFSWDDNRFSYELSPPKTDNALKVIGVISNKNKVSDLEEPHKIPTVIFTNKELKPKWPTLDKHKNIENIFKDDFFVRPINTSKFNEPTEWKNKINLEDLKQVSELYDPVVKQNTCTINANIKTVVKEATLDENKHVGGGGVINLDENKHVCKKPIVNQHITILSVNKKTKVKVPALDRNTNIIDVIDDIHKNKHPKLKKQLKKDKSFLKKSRKDSKVAIIKTPKNISKAKKPWDKNKSIEFKNKSKGVPRSTDRMVANENTDNENNKVQNENVTTALSIATTSNVNESKSADTVKSDETTSDINENIPNEQVSKIVTPAPSVENFLNVNQSDTNINTDETAKDDSNLELVDESINDDASSINEPTTDLNEILGPSEPYNIEEFVYLKHNNHIVKITFNSYNSLVPVGDGTRHCFVCWINVLCDELRQHVKSNNHLENMRSSKYMDHYNKNMIRWKNSTHHCSVCNVIIFGSVEAHLNWQHHENSLQQAKKTARQLVKDLKKHKYKQFKTCTTKKTYTSTNPVMFKIVPCDDFF